MSINRDAVQARIAALDLEPIKFKLVKEQGYSEGDVQILDKWYRRFLLLAATYKDQPIVVSEAIDNFWHQHILDTRKYAEDCELAFGEFLHHFPYFGLRGEEDQKALQAAYAATQQLMSREFGKTPDTELKLLQRSVSPDPELPSLCSDCSQVWDSGLHRDERPRLSQIAEI
jgi:hypothetical protein